MPLRKSNPVVPPVLSCTNVRMVRSYLVWQVGACQSLSQGHACVIYSLKKTQRFRSHGILKELTDIINSNHHASF